MTDLFTRVNDAVGALKALTDHQPDVALVLGTGLGSVAEGPDLEKVIPFSLVPGFRAAGVRGHKGNLVFGRLSGWRVVAMQGRRHLYEGCSLQDATLPIRVMRGLGARFLVINSAAGGLNPDFGPTDIMVVTDHINMMGANPLTGVSDDRLGDRFIDMSRAYDPELIELAVKASEALKIPLRKGVYAAVAGPSLETPAETRMLRMLGADAVGMSTVPEVIVGRQVGFRVLALAAITNVNNPDNMAPISVDSVIENAESAARNLASVLGEVLRRLKAYNVEGLRH